MGILISFNRLWRSKRRLSPASPQTGHLVPGAGISTARQRAVPPLVSSLIFKFALFFLAERHLDEAAFGQGGIEFVNRMGFVDMGESKKALAF
jgi:hypothetical protein